MFEVVPPTKRASQQYVEKVTNAVVESIKKMPQVSILNIPEIVDENYCGMPYYRNLDNLEFGKLLRDKCGKDILSNKVVVHFNPKEEFNKWLDNAVDSYGITNHIFVGGTYPLKYPGPTVLEANKIGSEKGISTGNIFIPTRPGEAEKLTNKTQSGCNFFTSQVLFEAQTTINAIKEYSDKCKQNSIKPSTFYLSFSPISDIQDIEFLKWLGASIDNKTESRFKNSRDIGKESLNIAKESYLKILSVCEENDVSCMPNIEQISFHNLKLSETMVQIFCDL